MVCAKCGAESVGGAKFCGECGAPLTVSAGDGEKRKTEVLFLTGNRNEATAALREALGCYERKGNLVSAERARAQLAQPD